MTTLAVDTPRDYELGDVGEIGAVAADIIYEGSAVGDNGSGYGRPLVAGDPFLGFNLAKVDNSSGSAGDVNVRYKKYGSVKLSVGSLAITDVGKAVYASDDATFTLTQSTNTLIGYVERFVSSGVGIVKFCGVAGVVTELTDSSGGTASDTLADVTEANNAGSADRVPVENAIASLAAKVNYLLRRQGH